MNKIDLDRLLENHKLYGLDILPIEFNNIYDLIKIPLYRNREWIINNKFTIRSEYKYQFRLNRLRQLYKLCNDGYFTIILPTLKYTLPFDIINNLDEQYSDSLFNNDLSFVLCFKEIDHESLFGQYPEIYKSTKKIDIFMIYDIDAYIFDQNNKYKRSVNTYANELVQIEFLINENLDVLDVIYFNKYNIRLYSVDTILTEALTTKIKSNCYGIFIVGKREQETNTFFKFNVPLIKYELICMLPHDNTVYTQGIIVDDHYYIESSGLYGKSYIRKTDLYSGIIYKENSLCDIFFGEGVAKINNRYYQLTWLEQKILIYDINSLDLINIIDFKKEWGINQGWGATSDGKYLMISDGTNKIIYIDMTDFKLKKVLTIKSNHLYINLINDICYENGIIYANVWPEDIILLIDSISGEVIGKISLSNLRNKIDDKAKELNGLAIDIKTKSLLVTGKYWDKLFLLKTNI